VSDAVLIEWFNAHYYKVTAGDEVKYLASVTTKLGILDKPQLARWRGDLGNREADLRAYEAAQKGTRIHWAYATALEGGAVVYDPWQHPVYTEEGLAALRKAHQTVAVLKTQEEMWAITKLAEQYRRLEPEVLGVEETVHDLEAGDAGTIDNILLIKDGEYSIAGPRPLRLMGGVYINDLKTGSFVGDDVWLQLAPYSIMYEKKHGVKVRGALVTHTGTNIKSGIPGLKTLFCSRELLDVYYQKYRRISDVWNDRHEGEQPETFEFPSLITMKPKIEEAA
jgi:hypothetical protein